MRRKALNLDCGGECGPGGGVADLYPDAERRGGIEADVTVARVAEDEFYIVTGTGFATHDFDWIIPAT